MSLQIFAVAPGPLAVLFAALESTQPAAVSLSLQEALERAEKHSPLVQRTRAQRDVVAAREVEASLLLPSNPVATVAVGPRRETRDTPSASGLQYALRAEQTIEIGGQRSARRQVVARALEIARARDALARSETRARVRSAYVTGQLATAHERLAARRDDLARQLYDSSRARLDAGAASEIELRMAEVERGRVERDRIEARLMVADALTALAVLVGLPAGQPIALTDALGRPDAPIPDAPSALARAQAARAELRIVAASRELVDDEVVRLRREAIPNPTLFVDFQRDLPGQVYLGGGLSLPLPVARRNQGPLAIARAERALLDLEQDLAEREIAIEVERGQRVAVGRREQARILEEVVVPAAETSARLVMDGWRAGKFDIFRVIQSAREAWEAQRGRLGALGDAWQADIELERVLGGTP